jgi:hypothetical protein
VLERAKEFFNFVSFPVFPQHENVILNFLFICGNIFNPILILLQKSLPLNSFIKSSYEKVFFYFLYAAAATDGTGTKNMVA